MCVVVPVVSVQHDDGCPLVRMTHGCKCIPTACRWGHVLRQLHKASLMLQHVENLDMMFEV